jgi:hypothetical protein
LYILNQIDVTANEDSLEEVFAAWQRALAQYGLTAGSSYAIYNKDSAIAFKNDDVRARYEGKRHADSSAISRRIEQVGVERAYRIVGMLEQTAQMLKQDVVSRLQRFIERWRRKVLWLEGAILAGLVAAFLAGTIWGGYWEGLSLKLPFWDMVTENSYVTYGALAVLIVGAGYVHFSIRRWAARKVQKKLLEEVKESDLLANYKQALHKSSRWWRSLFLPNPAGWGRRTADRLEQVVDDSNAYIQKLNDAYTNPSGEDKSELSIEEQAVENSNRHDLGRIESENTLRTDTGPVSLKD